MLGACAHATCANSVHASTTPAAQLLPRPSFQHAAFFTARYHARSAAPARIRCSHIIGISTAPLKQGSAFHIERRQQVPAAPTVRTQARDQAPSHTASAQPPPSPAQPPLPLHHSLSLIPTSPSPLLAQRSPLQHHLLICAGKAGRRTHPTHRLAFTLASSARSPLLRSRGTPGAQGSAAGATEDQATSMGVQSIGVAGWGWRPWRGLGEAAPSQDRRWDRTGRRQRAGVYAGPEAG